MALLQLDGKRPLADDVRSFSLLKSTISRLRSVLPKSINYLLRRSYLSTFIFRTGHMPDLVSFLSELDDEASRGSPERRLRALWHATDLLITGRYSEDEVWVFGEVIDRLANEIETVARCKLANRLACADISPINIVKKLASDKSIDVAGPILEEFIRLDVQTLIANATTGSQQHLLAISRRKTIDKDVTDILVKRGDREVIKSVAVNSGARLSDFGFLHLVKRSDGDSILAEHLGLRRDIPRHLFQQLIAKASDEVKRKLQRERPELADQIQTSVVDVAGALQSKFGPASEGYFAAKKTVGALHQFGNLDEKAIFEFSQSRKFEETTIGLSLLCTLPVNVVERALVDKNKELVLVLAKALDFSWKTTMSLLFLSAPDHRIFARDLDVLKLAFAGLNAEISKDVLKFYQSRKVAGSAGKDSRRLPQLHAN
jgi:uncharacterized protein (DUF2336 family)